MIIQKVGHLQGYPQKKLTLRPEAASKNSVALKKQPFHEILGVSLPLWPNSLMEIDFPARVAAFIHSVS